MAKVNPFHTNSPEYPPTHREVYHDTDTCPDGKRIKPEHRENGNGNKKHCLECEKQGEHGHSGDHGKHHDRPPQPDRRHAK
jgi:hypothetical protein